LVSCGCPERYENGITADREESYRWPRWRGADGREIICGVGKRIERAGGSPRKRTRRRGELRHWDGRRSRDFSVEIPLVLITARGHWLFEVGGSQCGKFVGTVIYATWC